MRTLPGLRVMASSAALWLVGCGGAPPVTSAEPPPPSRPPPAVAAVIHHGANGDRKPDSPFFVVLTRPVVPAPDALVLVDDAGSSLPGETTWLAPQLVAFYPHGPLAAGMSIHLRIAAALRARDGSTLPPAEIAADATPPIEATPEPEVGNLAQLGELRFSCERPPPATEIERLGRISIQGVPSDAIAFEARVEGTHVGIVAKSAFPPGVQVAFAWRDGPIAKTSVGRIHLDPVRANVRKGLELRVGESEDGCRWTGSGADGETWTCKGGVAHLVFTTPISDDAIAGHVHPPQRRATTGDLRGHRLEVTLGNKAVSVHIDGRLEDVFGQWISRGSNLIFRKQP